MVTARIPVFVSEDDRYFQDRFQGIPKEGYTKLISKMLDRNNIKVLTDTNFINYKNNFEYDQLFYTGMIDEYYDYCYGRLPYRSLRFDFEVISDCLPFQPAAQVNYPCEKEYTRITEFAHFQMNFDGLNETIIAKEYPLQFQNRDDEIPYYPIPQLQNINIYNKYRKRALNENVIFLGRLADYSYYNMDEAIKRALEVAKKYLNSK